MATLDDLLKLDAHKRNRGISGLVNKLSQGLRNRRVDAITDLNTGILARQSGYEPGERVGGLRGLLERLSRGNTPDYQYTGNYQLNPLDEAKAAKNLYDAGLIGDRPAYDINTGQPINRSGDGRISSYADNMHKDDDGNPIPAYTPKELDSRGNVKTYQPNPYLTDERKRKFKAKRDLDQYSADANQALIALDKIKVQSEQLGDFQRGIYNQATAKVSAGLGSFAKDQDIVRYRGVVAQELIPAARKLMEEKGPITESDIERVEEGLGDLTTPLQDKLFLLEELRKKVVAAYANKLEVAGVSPEEIRAQRPDLFQKLNAPSYTENQQISPQDAYSRLKASGKFTEEQIQAYLQG